MIQVLPKELERSIYDDLLAKRCPSALASVSNISSFENDFYQYLRVYLLRSPLLEEAQKILDVDERFFAMVRNALNEQLPALIQRHVAGIRLKNLDLLSTVPTVNLNPAERSKRKTRTDAEEIVLHFAKQYLLTVRDYSRIEPQLAITHFLISPKMANLLSSISSAQVLNLCDRAYSTLQFELTAPAKAYFASFEMSIPLSEMKKEALALTKLRRELSSTTNFWRKK